MYSYNTSVLVSPSQSCCGAGCGERPAPPGLVFPSRMHCREHMGVLAGGQLSPVSGQPSGPNQDLQLGASEGAPFVYHEQPLRAGGTVGNGMGALPVLGAIPVPSAPSSSHCRQWFPLTPISEQPRNDRPDLLLG